MDIPQMAFLMESVGAGEWIILFAVILIVMGPQRLPEMARKLGRWTETFRRAADEFKRQVMSMDEEAHHQASEYTDYGSGEGGEDKNPEALSASETTGEGSAPAPEGFSETEGQEYHDSYPSEGLPDSAQYYGNEELVADMEHEKKEEEKQA